MKKVNLLSKAEMKNVMGGDGETVGHIGGDQAVMFCRTRYVALIGDPVNVPDCAPSNWASYCAGKDGYSEEDSQCIYF